ncbi:MAG: 2-amino-4-hydroxy-6-hydroxymethyldihydropteridine diphosphokinase [Bacteroidaceae bacterium]|nr:2-amino-4-hydroxy-6-hydroxymethyldihydropteridine diphosphokinase [Bacteroidaceae bacterium]
MTKRLYLSLGTNLGNKRENLTRAIELLSLALGKCIAVSQFIETAPWGFDSENSFLNCVAAFETALAPMQLLDMTESIERGLGRTQKSNNGHYRDRIIDIDILLYGDNIIVSDRLTIPHPLMHKRDFVLEPLADIAPDAIHPILGKSIKELLEERETRNI